MKKLKSMLAILMLALSICMYTFAAGEFAFEVSYDGTVTKNVEKSVSITLAGVNAPLHSKVRINVKIVGPATPKLLATDSAGNTLDIAQIGYWGPAEGFPVQGTFQNVTPVKATFTQAGKYTITLDLVDIENASAVLVSKSIDITVLDEEVSTNQTVNNTTTTTPEELPKTGTSFVEYILYVAVIVGMIYFISLAIKAKRG